MKRTQYRVIGLLLFVLAVLLSGSCSRKKETAAISDNQVAGFLFHFDQREETKALLKLKNRGELPVSVTWYYPGEDAVEKTSQDPEVVKEIYTSLSNLIIMGNVNSNLEGRECYISFTLTDGSTCRFDFPSDGVIRLSEHNYSIETDGTLWELLK